MSEGPKIHSDLNKYKSSFYFCQSFEVDRDRMIFSLIQKPFSANQNGYNNICVITYLLNYRCHVLNSWMDRQTIPSWL